MNALTYPFVLLVFLSPILMCGQPVNDDFANAQAVTANLVQVINGADAVLLSAETDELLDCGGPNSFWYSITPTVPVVLRVTAEVEGAMYGLPENDTRVGIYTGTALDNLVELDCFDEDIGDGFGEDLLFPLDGGTTYLVRIAIINPVVDNDITTTIALLTELVWNGSLSPDWNEPLNWSPAQVPTAADLVYIPPGTPNACVVTTDGLQPVTNATALEVYLENTTLTVQESSSLTAGGGGFGLLMEGPDAVFNLSGQFVATNLRLAGLLVDEGSVSVTETGNFMISSANRDGIYVLDGAFDFNGTASTITGSGYDGIRVEGGQFTVGEHGVLTVTQTSSDGVFVIDGGSVTVSGLLTCEDSGEDGFDTRSGELMVATTGRLVLTKSVDHGLNNAQFNNDGEILIADFGFGDQDDGINTDEDCTNNGVIDIILGGGKGIDVESDKTFFNKGELVISDVDRRAVDDGTFINQAGGSLRVHGALGEALVFEPGSNLVLGAEIGCVTFEEDADLNGATVEVEINGVDVCTQYGQLKTVADLNLNDAVLRLTGNLDNPDPNAEIVIAMTAYGGTLIGSFGNAPEGTLHRLNGVDYLIEYRMEAVQSIVLTPAEAGAYNEELDRWYASLAVAVADASGDEPQTIFILPRAFDEPLNLQNKPISVKIGAPPTTVE
ncbi:MAG: hypothetical protein AAF597_06040 [Bacteroidota bacterium]